MKLSDITRNLGEYCITVTFFSCLAAFLLVRGLQIPIFQIWGLAIYLMLTAGTILVGHQISKIPDNELREALNRLYQRKAVIALNVIVGAIATGIALLTDIQRLKWFLVAMIAYSSLYAVSYLAKIIRPHTFLARFRSVIGRCLITLIICEMIYPRSWHFLIIAMLSVLTYSWSHLRSEQARHHWPFR